MKPPIGAGKIGQVLFILFLRVLGTSLVTAQETSPAAGGSPVSFPAPEGGSLEVTLLADNGALTTA